MGLKFWDRHLSAKQALKLSKAHIDAGLLDWLKHYDEDLRQLYKEIAAKASQGQTSMLIERSDLTQSSHFAEQLTRLGYETGDAHPMVFIRWS